jgi:hydroxyacylglutathione hydrolase
MKVEQLILGPLETNCYIIHHHQKAIIIDPGDSPNQIQQFLQEKHLTPQAILLTHAHFDHIGAVASLRKEFGLKVYLHPLEHDWLENPLLNGSNILQVTPPISTEKADVSLMEGTLTIGEFSMEVRHVPGHSPGSMAFLFEKFIIAGDTLFRGSIGRWDLPGGNYHKLIESIRTKIVTLQDDIIVYPGHGPKTTVGEEKLLNPFLKNN